MTQREAIVVTLPSLTNGTFGVRENALSMRNGFVRPASTKLSSRRRVTTTAVNMESTTPAVRVIAKPRTGPVPTMKRMMPVTMVVMLESRIAVNARP